MAECKVVRHSGYTVMSNYHLRDKRLSLKAKGLLSVILSLPDDWDYTISGLAVICDCGRDMIRAAITELEKAGYITRSQINEAGKFGGNQYVIRETPVEQTAEPLPGFPATENPPTENPLPENPTQIIKDQSITDGMNTTPAALAEPTVKKVKKNKDKDRGKAVPKDLLDDGQMRNLLVAQVDEFGTAFGLDAVRKNRLYKIAVHWYTPRTLAGKNAQPPVHTELGVIGLFRKLARGARVVGADAAIEVFYDALSRGHTDIHDDRFKVGYQGRKPVAAPPSSSVEEWE